MSSLADPRALASPDPSLPPYDIYDAVDVGLPLYWWLLALFIALALGLTVWGIYRQRKLRREAATPSLIPSVKAPSPNEVDALWRRYTSSLALEDLDHLEHQLRRSLVAVFGVEAMTATSTDFACKPALKASSDLPHFIRFCEDVRFAKSAGQGTPVLDAPSLHFKQVMSFVRRRARVGNE